MKEREVTDIVSAPTPGHAVGWKQLVEWTHEQVLEYAKARGASTFELYREAAEAGNAIAQNRLGVHYLNGEGTDQNYTQAIAWFSKSAEQGYSHAQFNLGFSYDNALGVKHDGQRAVAWYQNASDQGHVGAQNNLGYCYEHGLGVSRDDEQAAAWYQKAAEKDAATPNARPPGP